MKMNNEKNQQYIKQTTRKNKIVFYIAVCVGLLFLALGFVSWNNAVKETNALQTRDEALEAEESWRAEYLNRMDDFFAVEEEYRKEVLSRNYENIEAGSKKDWENLKLLVEEALDTEKAKRSFFRNNESPKYFSSFQAKNLNGTATSIEGLELIKEALEKDDGKKYEEGVKVLKRGMVLLDESVPAYNSAKKLSESRLANDREELEEEKANSLKK